MCKSACLLSGFRGGDQQKEAPSAADPAKQESRENSPDKAIEAGLEFCGGLVQQQVARTELRTHLYIAESGHELPRLFVRVTFRAGTLPMIKSALPQ